MKKTIWGFLGAALSLVAAADVVSLPEAAAREVSARWPLVLVLVAGVALIIILAARRRKAAAPPQ